MTLTTEQTAYAEKPAYINFTLHNVSGQTIGTPNKPALEYKSADGWQEVLTRLWQRSNNGASTAPMSEFQPADGKISDGKQTQCFNLCDYGMLRAGTYRLTLELHDQTFVASNEFTIGK